MNLLALSWVCQNRDAGVSALRLDKRFVSRVCTSFWFHVSNYLIISSETHSCFLQISDSANTRIPIRQTSIMSYERQQDFGGNVPHGGAYPAGGGYPRDDDDDLRGASEHASRHAGSSGSSDLFSSLLGSLTQKKHSLASEEVDEDDAVKQHKRFFGRDDDEDEDEADDRSMGSAAAIQALKMFSGGQSGSSHESNSQSAFVGLAMAEASKLFDQKASQGKVSSDSSKESAVMKAGEMALKMYLKSNGGGGSSSSGSSGLLGLASKFL
ncbi:hypothetical protein F4805DRAFT_449239 [Annulohypoxylon moriforme]|nr:hypothetical protein F4805DRAFT_449239 [Annulohypoxylon moriforme]